MDRKTMMLKIVDLGLSRGYIILISSWLEISRWKVSFQSYNDIKKILQNIRG
jgi:hypothetical protein